MLTALALTPVPLSDLAQNCEPGLVRAGGAIRLLDLARVPTQEALQPEDFLELSWEALPEHSGDLQFAFAYGAEDQHGAFDRFLAPPVVQALPAARADQVIEIDGTETVGSARGEVHDLMGRMAKALRRDGLDCDHVAE